MQDIKQSGDTELSGIPPDLGESDFSNLGDSPISGEPTFFKAYFDNEDLNLQGYNFSFQFSTTYRIQRYMTFGI